MKMKINKYSVIYTTFFLVALITLGFFVFFTSPKNLPVFLLLVPVIAIFTIFYLIFYWIIRKSIFSNKEHSIRSSSFLATIYAIIPVLLLALASTRQFTLGDVGLALFLFFCVAFYFSRVDFL
jgi:hypothetical protein